MSRFAILNRQWPSLAEAAAKVEVFANSDPRTACFWARRALELAVSRLSTRRGMSICRTDIVFVSGNPLQGGSGVIV